jgi:hypothetical protein
MKRKSPRDIPQFAPHAPQNKDGSKRSPEPVAPHAIAPPPAQVRAKPPATSAKSGQRGK